MEMNEHRTLARTVHRHTVVLSKYAIMHLLSTYLGMRTSSGREGSGKYFNHAARSRANFRIN